MPGRSQFELERDAQKRVARDLQAQKAASSRPGQVYHTMTSLADRMTRPGYQGTQSDINQLKGLRRDWNRNQKYTPMGMQVSGATTPGGAQDAFVNMSRALRQGNKPAYNKMYPLTGGFMDVAEKGGLWGSLLREIGGKTRDRVKDFGSYLGEGITDALRGDSDEEKEEYVAKTFGFYPSDVHPDEYDITDTAIADWYEPEEVIESPGPIDRHPDKYPISREAGQPPAGAVDVTGDPTRRRDVGYDITASDLDVAPMPPADYGDLEYFDWVDKYYDTHNPDGTPKADPRVIPGGGTSYVDDFADVVGEEEVPTALPPYQGREFGLGQFMKEMPSSRKRDWEDYLKYVQRLGDMEAGYHKQKLTYDEWQRMMRRRR